MKNLFLYLVAILFYFQANAQSNEDTLEWAPVGAKWWYTVQYAPFGPYAVTYRPMTIESVGDTMINGKNCKILVKSETNCSDYHDTSYIYVENDTVFWYIPLIDDFTILYDFSISTSGFWQTITHNQEYVDTCLISIIIDSVGLIIFNNDTLKTLHRFGWKSKIIEKIGSLRYLLPLPVSFCPNDSLVVDCYYTLVKGIRCYQDNELGLYQRWDSIPCDTSYYILSIDEDITSEQFSILLYPNPGNELLSIDINCSVEHTRVPIKYTIYDMQGRNKGSGALECGYQNINTEYLKQGNYILNVLVNESMVNRIFIIN